MLLPCCMSMDMLGQHKPMVRRGGAPAASYTRRATRQQTEYKGIIVHVKFLSGVVLKQRTQ